MPVTLKLSGLAARQIASVIAFLSLAFLAACGSGAVSTPPATLVPLPLSVLPATATLFSNLPTTFIVSGGTGSYIVTSSDQATLPITGAFTGNSFTVTPNPVAADTPVTLTVRDSGTTTPVTAALTVKPRVVSNIVTITPSASQPSGCGTALCSGGDAEVKASLSQNGVPIAGHEVRFEVVSGGFRIITSAPGQPELLSLTGSTISDGAGVARIRIRADASAAPQTALIQITDVSSGAFQRTSFVIAQSPGFFVTPTAVTFIGPNLDQCAASGSADFFVFGGAPPYTISNTSPQAFSVSRSFLSNSGDSFTVSVVGGCVAEPGAPIVVRDSQGRVVTVTAANKVGTRPSTTPLQVSPSTVTLSECTTKASVTVVGGSGVYTTVTDSSAIFFPEITGNTLTIQRANATPPLSSPAHVTISDGQSNVTVTVNLVGNALTQQCP
jgi:hypothetical protein